MLNSTEHKISTAHKLNYFLWLFHGSTGTEPGGFMFLWVFTCVALAKAGLVVGPLRPSVRPFVRSSVRLSVRPSVRPSVRNTFGVPSLCNL